MSSRKLQALDFIKRYFARWSQSPTLGELSAELGVSRKRAHELVHQLAEEEMIEHEAGQARGIRLVDRGEEMSETDVLLRLAALGWTISHGQFVIEVRPPPSDACDATAATILESLSHGPAKPTGAVKGVTDKGLHRLPVLDHKPDLDRGAGAGTSGQTKEGRQRPGPAGAARGAPRRASGGMGAPAS